MKLQVSSQLAVLAMVELVANADRQLTVAEIGAKYGASSHHLAKVMHVLGDAGLVRAIRGAGGGYQFSGNARRTTLLDVIELFERLGPSGQDVGAAGEGTSEGLALHAVLREIDDTVRATLGSITLATFCGLMKRRQNEPSAPRSRPSSVLTANR
ncbi:MAG: Rrf2 family transcriptional regulator [Gammaproteobacteria bacterium]|nr:Rrf2 family transcriptional regulator [Gammaproteobacteria bacterium]